jgi:hypothetical protein
MRGNTYVESELLESSVVYSIKTCTGYFFGCSDILLLVSMHSYSGLGDWVCQPSQSLGISWSTSIVALSVSFYECAGCLETPFSHSP